MTLIFQAYISQFISLNTSLSSYSHTLLLLFEGALCIEQQMDISIKEPLTGLLHQTVHQTPVFSLISTFPQAWQRKVKASVPLQWTLLLGVKLILNNDITSVGSVLLGWRAHDSSGKLAFISMINWRMFGHTTAGEQPRMCMQFCVCVGDKHGQQVDWQQLLFYNAESLSINIHS